MREDSEDVSGVQSAVCSILYTGGSKDLQQRLEQLLCKEDKHTIEHAVRALLLNGWRTECAWKPPPNYREEEKQRKTAPWTGCPTPATRSQLRAPGYREKLSPHRRKEVLTA